MIPLIPGRRHILKGGSPTLVFRRKEGQSFRTHVLPNVLIYVGPHPTLPHLALLKSEQNPNWFYWDIPENFHPLDDIPQESLVGGFRATRLPDTLWARKDA